MFYDVLPRYTVRFDNAVVSGHGIRPMKVDAPVEFQLTISNGETRVDRLQLACVVMKREDMVRLRDELNQALALTPATPEEVRNHHEHKAWQVEKDRGW